MHRWVVQGSAAPIPPSYGFCKPFIPYGRGVGAFWERYPHTKYSWVKGIDQAHGTSQILINKWAFQPYL